MKPNTTTTTTAHWLDVEAVAERFGVSKNTIWRWVREGKFPAPVKLGENCTRWRIADITAWENSLSAA